ncbi:hypothetical protein BJ742DRAFT_676737 [Cladochytrium replicatum]|nr:hypothetical protein BJ742DRAFT_676737 [Cladochytrium replicatum]
MGNVSPPDVGNVELTTVEPVGAEQALSPQAPTFTKCSPPPQERNAVERSPERHRESSECSEFVFVDEDETESTDSGSDFEFPSKSGSSRRGRQAAGRRSGHKQSALDHRRSSIVSTVSEISCVSSCDSEYSVAESTRGQQRRQANPKRNQQQEDCDSDKRRHWSCEQCGKRFTRKFNLGQHMRIHSGRKPYVCQVENCGMAFVRDYDRKRHHISVHDLDKPFKCTHCDLQFPRWASIILIIPKFPEHFVLQDAYHRHLMKVGLM